MDAAIDGLSWACLMAGAALTITGALGLVRLPDVFARVHAVALIDTGGLGLMLVGLMLQAGFSLAAVKLAMILAFVVFTLPTATHALARAALEAGVVPLTDQSSDEGGPSSKTSSSSA